MSLPGWLGRTEGGFAPLHGAGQRREIELCGGPRQTDGVSQCRHCLDMSVARQMHVVATTNSAADMCAGHVVPSDITTAQIEIIRLRVSMRRIVENAGADTDAGQIALDALAPLGDKAGGK